MSVFEHAASPQAILISAIVTVAAIIIYHWLFVRGLRRTTSDPRAMRSTRTGSPDVAELQARVAAVESTAQQALQYVGFVRFNAFPDVGSQLSFALAVVDGAGNGFLVTSIYSREEVRTYAKAIRAFAADKDVSSEEARALGLAREQSKRGIG